MKIGGGPSNYAGGDAKQAIEFAWPNEAVSHWATSSTNLWAFWGAVMLDDKSLIMYLLHFYVLCDLFITFCGQVGLYGLSVQVEELHSLTSRLSPCANETWQEVTESWAGPGNEAVLSMHEWQCSSAFLKYDCVWPCMEACELRGSRDHQARLIIITSDNHNHTA